MEIKKVDEKYSGVSPELSGITEGITLGAMAYTGIAVYNDFKVTKPAQLRNWGLIAGAIGAAVGVFRYFVDTDKKERYESAARSNNAAVDVLAGLIPENQQLKNELVVERQRYTDLARLKHSAHGEHAEHSANVSHHTAHAKHEHANADHGNHAEKHGKPHATHAEKAAATKQEAAEAPLSL